MQGKVLDVITNMYIKAKSCVSINGAESGYFPCHTGVRQGENLSPLLFSIYLSDLNNFLSSECTSLSYLDSIQEDLLDREVSTFFKLYLLMYADDTVLLAESPKDLQTSLNAMKEYCTLFDLKVNISKTKIMIFSRGKLRKPHSFYFGDEKLDVVNEYNYLGLIFNYNAKFNVAKKFLYQKGSRAMFALLKKIRKLALPVDIALKLFNNLVKPVILYGAEVWGCENYDIFEKLQLRFCKYILSVNKSTCSNMVYGELGVMPVNIDVKTRMIVYWAKLICGNQGKISNLIYSLLYKLDQLNIFKSDWIHTIKSILNNSGFSGIWLSQSIPHSADNLRDKIKIRLKDQFIQQWYEGISHGGKCTNYRIFKKIFTFEKYLTELPDQLRKNMTKFRCRNHRLPIESGCRTHVSRDMRICQHCRKDIGDEYHYLLSCPHFTTERAKYIKKTCWQKPSAIQLERLMNNTNSDDFRKLSMFVKFILSTF